MPKKILIAEDDILLGPTLKMSLEDKGYEVTWCRDREAALRVIGETIFDGVITDKDLGPKDTGFDVASAARAGGMMPILMMSGGVKAIDLPLVEGRLKKIGGDIGFVAKGTDLITKVEELIDKLNTGRDIGVGRG